MPDTEFKDRILKEIKDILQIAAVSCVYEGSSYVARAKLEGKGGGCAATGTSEEQALDNLRLTIRAYLKSIGEE